MDVKEGERKGGEKEEEKGIKRDVEKNMNGKKRTG